MVASAASSPREPDSLSSLPAHAACCTHRLRCRRRQGGPSPRCGGRRYRQQLNGPVNAPGSPLPSRQVAEHEGLIDEQVAELRREWGENALPEKGKSKLVLLLTLARAPTLRALTDPPPLPLPTDYWS